MKNFIVFIFSILMASSLLGSVSKSNFDVYDNLVRNKANVVEQGVKIQYRYDGIYKKEIESIKSLLKIESDFNIYDKNFYYHDKTNKYSIEIKGIDSFVEVEIKYFIENIKVEEIEKKLEAIFNTKRELESFSYIKAKANNNFDIDKEISILNENSRIKEITNLKISSGVTGTIKFYNKKEYNYSFITYEKDDNYIIVGSPVIFTVY